MKFSAVSSFVIIGGGQSVLDITKYVIEIGCKAKVVTSPRHASESNEASGTFESAVKELGAKCIVVGDINSDLDFDEILDDETFGIAIGPAWIFHQPMLTAFSGRLVNFHSIPLPRFRGGAHFTWQILQRDRTGGLNIQLIDRKLDAGAVIMTESYSVPNGARKPIDYFNALDQHALPFLQRFLDRVLAESEFEKVPLKEESSLYMPRLSTVDQAFIDWSWSGDDILKFIDAFDDPYSGASTFIDGRRVRLKHCDIVASEEMHHPFQSGLIVRKSRRSLYVATTTGILKIRQSLLEDGSDAYTTVRLGHRLHTPTAMLDQAKSFEARYTATGLDSSVADT